MLHEHGDEAHAISQHGAAALADRLSREITSLWGEQAAQDMTALVAANTEFRGIIQFNGTVRIDGRVEGEIHTEGLLLIGKDAIIRATVTAGAIVSCGTIIGDVTAKDSIKLLAPAVLRGSVKTPLLSMEEGVRFVGSLAVNQDGEGEQALPSVPEQDVAEVANS